MRTDRRTDRQRGTYAPPNNPYLAFPSQYLKEISGMGTTDRHEFTNIFPENKSHPVGL